MKIKKMAWVPDGSGFKTIEPHSFLVRSGKIELPSPETGDLIDCKRWFISKFDEFGDTHEYDSYYNDAGDAMKWAEKIWQAEIGEFLCDE